MFHSADARSSSVEEAEKRRQTADDASNRAKQSPIGSHIPHPGSRGSSLSSGFKVDFLPETSPHSHHLR